MDLPSAVSNVDSTLTRVTQTPSEIRSDRLLVAYSITRNIKRDGFCTKLNISEEAVYMFQEWSQGTYQRLRQQMDQYSVFSGRNVLVRVYVYYTEAKLMWFSLQCRI